ncbi:Methylthioribose-1-phosphate isomerase [Candidatus Terasakiella magnetica]|uniref:Methylthioribose-1-phosphate isomerase n=1 Tax=Candidatus Terasakiella magnetica TaxID=1867952 RepID=A0A1C3RJ30_9PROT|nr:S-methyl-5-thioribose-1-phosphate isomerase [Candidatus Terasakiella magnetica]SCA57274.1 Methylthioribose-1-phosphate isomerase [Candidatus Terasakiella magnetica]
MKVNGTSTRPIWLDDDGWGVNIIDQTKLPHAYEIVRMENLADACHAIFDMLVRGAPLIGATAAYGMALALKKDASDAGFDQAYSELYATRPTAVNLRWALDEMRAQIFPLAEGERIGAAYKLAAQICEDDVAQNSSIGDHGLKIIQEIWEKKGKTGVVNILTHCNAGWLATVDWGTATAPIYKAHDSGIPVHVWVDETRPRNQGASLTAWELGNHGVDHTLIVDNAGGHLMQHGEVDLCIVGTDRTTASGDVCNKIGTYLKALAAHDNDVPFYVGLPSPTIDWTVDDGVKEIPIEERDATEVTEMTGRLKDGTVATVTITPESCTAGNYAFDVTPRKYITGLITERGVAKASKEGLAVLFPDKV